MTLKSGGILSRFWIRADLFRTLSLTLSSTLSHPRQLSSTSKCPDYSSLTMNSKHLTAGDPLPPVQQDGKMRIYNMRFCPFGQRAILVAEAKGIPHEIVNIQLRQTKPDWFLELNPNGTVPAIETPQGPLYESLIVAEYLDETYPNRKLTPSDPYQKALDKIWIENVSKVARIHYKLLANAGEDVEVAKDLLKQLAEAVAIFEIELKRRGSLFFGGSQPAMIDYCIWPWFERLGVVKLAYPKLYDYDSAKLQHPALEKWRQAMKEDKAVKASYIPPEVHHKFVIGLVAGSPNYELVNEK